MSRRASAMAVLLPGVLLAALTSLLPPTVPGAAAGEAPRFRDLVFTSHDGTPLAVTLMLPAGASRSRPVPVVLETHGWGGERVRRPGALEQRLLDRGYAVLTWDSRGFGDSGGEASPAGPAEIADARALVSWLARRDDILRDGPRDPRVGWIGPSNAAGIQLNTAAVDHRLDAIVPLVPWGDLRQDLWPHGVVKTAWWEGVYALGLASSLSGGLDSPAGTQLGTMDQHIHATHAELLATGEMSADNKRWWQRRSTTPRVGAITTPTMLVQGTIDTFFPLEDGFANYRRLVRAGTPVKLVAACNGHTVAGCAYGRTRSDVDARTGRVVWQDALVAWLDRWVKRDRGVRTGPRFVWQGNDGRYRGAAGFPLPGTTWVTGRTMRTGTLVGPGLTGGDGPASGAPAEAVELGVTAARAVVLPASRRVRHVVGVPRVRLTGTGTGLTSQVHLELVDLAPDGTRVTLDDQTMPWRFAGTADRTVALHGVAWRLRPGHRLELEVTTGSTQYLPPRTGPFTVDLTATIRLPVVWPR